MTRGIALGLLLLVGSAGAAADPAIESSALRARAESLLAEGIRADRRDLVSTAREVMDRLPRHDGNPTAGRLLATALAIDSSASEGAFGLAMRLRSRMIEGGDAEAGVPFLRRLADLYPHDGDLHRKEAGRLLARVGRGEEARAEYALALDAAPDDARAAAVLMAIAELCELADDVDAAIAGYEAAARRGEGGWGHLRRAQLLRRFRGDLEAAKQVLATAREAAGREEPGTRLEIERGIVAEERAIHASESRREELRQRVRRVDRTVLLVGLGWLVVLVGGGVWLCGSRDRSASRSLPDDDG